MALTESNMLPLNSQAPEFNLPDTVSDKILDLEDLKGAKGTIIMFICNHCPYVIHVIEEIVNISKEYEKRGFNFIAISSNDVENYPEDSPEKMKLFAKQYDFNFPYLYDETQNVATAYDAACTPDIYIFDENLELYYRGRMDESRPGNDKAVDGRDLRNALDSLLANNDAPLKQYPSAGCGIKWKK